MPHDIDIIGGNTSTGLLELSDNGSTQADKGVPVKWEILQSNVTSIEIVAKDPTDDIWQIEPHPQPPQNNRKWMGITDPQARDDSVYRYLINWESTSGSRHTHDPLISIRPSRLP